MSVFKKILISLLLSSGLASASLWATESKLPIRPTGNAINVQLISEYTTLQPGSTSWLALNFYLPEGWHIYWHNPGAAGYPPKITWDKLPAGVTISAWLFPYPSRFGEALLYSYGYEKNATLLAKLTVAPTAKPGRLWLKGHANWLACQYACQPEEAMLKLPLTIGATSVPDLTYLNLFEEAHKKIPSSETGWQVRAYQKNEQLILKLTNPDFPVSPFTEVTFYPLSNDLIEIGAAQTWTFKNGEGQLTLSRKTGQPLPTHLAGVLVANAPWESTSPALAINIDTPLTVYESSASILAIFAWLSLAFLGGLLLNLMPCVLPVLSLKILNFVEQSKQPSRHLQLRPWHHGLAFSAGVLATFWLLAGILLAFKSTGTLLGWGFQLQSPTFVIFLAFLFFLIALNLLGFLEITWSVAWLSPRQSGLTASFLSGLLTTLVATPCTAPFMGTALGAALTKSPTVACLIFTSLALGMASPYLVLSIFPGWLKRIPPPGAWMINLKQFLAFPLFATVLWLSWVLGQQTDLNLVLRLWLGLLLISFAVWLSYLGRNWQGLKKELAIILAVILAIYSLYGVITYQPLRQANPTSTQQTLPPPTATPALTWQPYSPGRLHNLRLENRYVILKFGAAWCLTCQTNDLVFQSSQLQEKLQKLNVALLSADWTKKQPHLTALIYSFGRSGVPLTLLYKPGQKNPVILPEILTPGALLTALEQTEPQESTENQEQTKGVVRNTSKICSRLHPPDTP